MAELYHYGIKRRSGRYPYGSGKEPATLNLNRDLFKMKMTMSKENAARKTETYSPELYLFRTEYSYPDARQKEYVKVDGKWMSAALAARSGEFKSNPIKTLSSSDIKSINANLGSTGTLNNCTKCTAVAELKARGYDVTAGRSLTGYDGYVFQEIFDGVKWDSAVGDDMDDKFKDSIKRYPDGARGYLNVTFSDGGAHAVHWTRVGMAGFQIEDAQTGMIFENWADFYDAYGPFADHIEWGRLDNAKIDWGHMEEFNVIRGPEDAERAIYDTETRNLMDDKYKLSRAQLDSVKKTPISNVVIPPKVKSFVDEVVDTVKRVTIETAQTWAQIGLRLWDMLT